MIFDPKIRQMAINKLAPDKKYIWKGEEWTGLSFEDSEFSLEESIFEIEYNIQKTIFDREEILKNLDAGIKNILENKAKEYGYESMQTAVTYAEEDAVIKFKDEGKALRKWRSEVYAEYFILRSEIERGERDTLSLRDLTQKIPKLDMSDKLNG